MASTVATTAATNGTTASTANSTTRYPDSESGATINKAAKGTESAPGITNAVPPATAAYRQRRARTTRAAFSGTRSTTDIGTPAL
ncbi:hypothetical protein GCM10009539_25110 [Cryptosporangium japonicum]|uniref:Uncharacterized protein n=1 Tax=Cryptosporangium japonicum TaxID=80872 RepID=A0ABP3DT87_9ACTN